MGRICAVANCLSGRYADQSRRRRLELRQASMFQIPKRNNALQSWSAILGLNLTMNDLICELHFCKEDILTEDQTIFPNGVVHIVPRQRPSLARNAMPVAIIVEENIDPPLENVGLNEPQSLHGPSMHAENFGEHLLASSPASHEVSAISVQQGDYKENNEPNVLNSSFDFADHLLDASDNITCHEGEDTVHPAVDMDISNERRPESSSQSQKTRGTSDSSRYSSWNSGLSHHDAVGDQRHEDEPHADRMEFVIDDVFDHLQSLKIPETWSWITNPREDDSVIFVQIDSYTLDVRLRVILHADLSVTAHTTDGKANMELETFVTSAVKIEELLKDVGGKVLCEGSGLAAERRDKYCPGFLSSKEFTKFIQHPRCCFCRKLRRNLISRQNRRKTDPKTRYARSKYLTRMKQRACKRLRQKLRQEISEAKERSAAIGEEVFDEAISDLPLVQQQAVRVCFNASKLKTSNQRRYSLNWVYECLLMRIKNSKLYEHLRSHNILPLPCQDTLSRYIQKLGTLLIDEKSLSEAISLDRQTLKYNGFVYLGEHIPESYQNIRGDHALVFMFQPFRGKWVQVLGCFVSKNSVTSQVLHKLVVECLLLLSNTGFHADVVTMDGAQWNRGVWKLFGIQDGHLRCEHPADLNERLRMMSEFPHLVKCWRNAMTAVKSCEFQTPYGMVKMGHYNALLTLEGFSKPNMSIAYKLTPEHINPKDSQKMNVPLAFELFSDRVAAAMELCMDDPKCPELRDAAPTIAFIKIVGNLIRPMMSRTPGEELRLKETCKNKKAIEDFVQFLQSWQDDAKANKYSFPISSSTVTGLQVTLGSTLELLESLHNKFNYAYLITARLNQDALEVRNAKLFIESPKYREA